MSCDNLVAKVRHYVLSYSKYITLIKLSITYKDIRMLFIELLPRSRILHEKLNSTQLFKKFPFYGIRRFITAFTRTRHLSLSWATTIQSIPPTPHFLKIHFNIILPSTPGFPKWFFFPPRASRTILMT